MEDDDVNFENELCELSTSINVPIVYLVGPNVDNSHDNSKNAWRKISLVFKSMQDNSSKENFMHSEEVNFKYVCIDNKETVKFFGTATFSDSINEKKNLADIVPCLRKLVYRQRTEPCICVYFYFLNVRLLEIENYGEQNTKEVVKSLDSRASLVGRTPGKYLLSLSAEIKSDKELCNLHCIQYVCLMIIDNDNSDTNTDIFGEIQSFICKMSFLDPKKEFVSVQTTDIYACPSTIKQRIIVPFIYPIFLHTYESYKADLLLKFSLEINHTPKKRSTSSEEAHDELYSMLYQNTHTLIKFKYLFLLSIVHENLKLWELAVRDYRNFIVFTLPYFGNLVQLSEAGYLSDEDNIVKIQLKNLLDYSALKISTIFCNMDMCSHTVVNLKLYIYDVQQSYPDSKFVYDIWLSKIYLSFTYLVKNYQKRISSIKASTLSKYYNKSDSDVNRNSFLKSSSTASLPSSLLRRSSNSIADSKSTEFMSKISNAGKTAFGVVTSFIKTTFKRNTIADAQIVNRDFISPYYFYSLEAIIILYHSFINSNFDDSLLPTLISLLEDSSSTLKAHKKHRTSDYLILIFANVCSQNNNHEKAFLHYMDHQNLLMFDNLFAKLAPSNFISNALASTLPHVPIKSLTFVSNLINVHNSRHWAESITLQTLFDKYVQILTHAFQKHIKHLKFNSRLSPNFFDAHLRFSPEKIPYGAHTLYHFTIKTVAPIYIPTSKLIKIKLIFAQNRCSHTYIHCSSHPIPIEPIFNDDSINKVNLNSSDSFIISRSFTPTSTTKLIPSTIHTTWLIENLNIKLFIKYNLKKRTLVFSNFSWLTNRCTNNIKTSSYHSFLHASSTLTVYEHRPVIGLSSSNSLPNYFYTGRVVKIPFLIDNPNNFPLDVTVQALAYANIDANQNSPQKHVYLSINPISTSTQKEMLNLNQLPIDEDRASVSHNMHLPPNTSQINFNVYIVVPYSEPGVYVLQVFILNSALTKSSPLITKITYLSFEMPFLGYIEVKRIPSVSNFVYSRNILTNNFTQENSKLKDNEKTPSSDLPTGIILEYMIYLSLHITAKDPILIEKILIPDMSIIKCTENDGMNNIDSFDNKYNQNQTASCPTTSLICPTTNSSCVLYNGSDTYVTSYPGEMFKNLLKAILHYTVKCLSREKAATSEEHKNSKRIQLTIIWAEKSDLSNEMGEDYQWQVASLTIDFPPSRDSFPSEVCADLVCVQSITHSNELPIILPYKPIDIHYIIHNNSLESKKIEFKVIQCHRFTFSGPEKKSMIISPLTSYTVPFTVIPLETGYITLPMISAMSIIDPETSESGSRSKKLISNISDLAISHPLCKTTNGSIKVLVMPDIQKLY